jgi:hypothetical protein
MLANDATLAPNAQEVAGEVIDREAIVINLSTGIYYSMDGVGAAIWALVEEHCTLEQIVASVVAAYDVDADRAENDVRAVVEELVRERLVVVAEHEESSDVTPEDAADKLAYVTPRLTSYHDMGDLLALDPPAPGLQEIPWKARAEGPPA